MIVLDIQKRARKSEHKPGSACCRTNMVICPGYGDENYNFPTAKEAVARCLERVEELMQEGVAKAKSDASPKSAQGPLKGFLPGLPSKGIVPPRAADPVPSQQRRVKGVDATLFAAAEGIRLRMDADKYEAIVAERFDDHTDKVQWAKQMIGRRWRRFRPAILSLENQLNKLRRLYLETLPRVLSVLVAQNPDESEGRLLLLAIQVLDGDFAPIISVLRIWTDAFGQLRSGNYKQLEAVVFAVEQAFRLFEGMEPAIKLTAEIKERLKTSKFHVGNVFVARFSENGPATLPGTRGPIGAHAIEVPHDERNMITLMLVLYMHEFRHDIFADVEGLGDEVTNVVAKAIADSIESGDVVLSEKFVRIERTNVPLANVMVKLFADNIGEVDADISGGVLLSGPTYLYNMLTTFSAFNSKPEGVFSNPRLLRTGSYFTVQKLDNNQKTIEFWPHPPDYIRAYIVAAALDEIGFHAHADQCRLLADQAVGEIPEYITWRNDNPKSKSVIRIKVADLKLLAPVIAKALIRTPLAALGGLATCDIINWTERREMKVVRLAEILMSGSSEIPTDIGDVYATYVASAASLAYWLLVKSGTPPLMATLIVEENALAMLETLRQRYDDEEQGLGDGSEELTDGTESDLDVPTAKPKPHADETPDVCDPSKKNTGCRGGTVS